MARIITFGEIMLRLKSPALERFFQSPSLEATFGGGEANVACKWNRSTLFISLYPNAWHSPFETIRRLYDSLL